MQGSAEGQRALEQSGAHHGCWVAGSSTQWLPVEQLLSVPVAAHDWHRLATESVPPVLPPLETTQAPFWQEAPPQQSGDDAQARPVALQAQTPLWQLPLRQSGPVAHLEPAPAR